MFNAISSIADLLKMAFCETFDVTICWCDTPNAVSGNLRAFLHPKTLFNNKTHSYIVELILLVKTGQYNFHELGE